MHRAKSPKTKQQQHAPSFLRSWTSSVSLPPATVILVLPAVLLVITLLLIRGMTKHPRDGVTLSLSLSLGEEAERGAARRKQPRRRASGEEFVCKTCSRAFASFQALGGHRTSHLRGRHHGLALGRTTLLSPPNNNQLDDAAVVTATTTTTAHDEKDEKPPAATAAAHECHFCGAAFEMGQALGGHMRRHREEVIAQQQAAPPVLLQLFV